jgi:hypothetical protein
MLKIFIDTEFTDFNNCYLISLGMAAESGEEFYVEVPFPIDACSEFVRQTVVPLLDKIPHSYCALEDLFSRIVNWLNIVRHKEEIVEICFDSTTDWELFTKALEYRVPSWCKPRSISDELKEFLIFYYHDKNNLPEHHSLFDAQANRYAFREAAD